MTIIDNPMKYRVQPYYYYNTLNNIDTSVTNNYEDMNVTKLIALNNSQVEDPDVCWVKGLNGVNQQKVHVARNGILKEKYAKKNIQNAGFLGCSLVLYYLESDSDFDTWYRTCDLRKSGNDYAP